MLLAGWFVALLAIGAGQLARHLVALPAAHADARTSRAMASLRAPDRRERWLAVHVLYAACRCSQRIVEHLAHRGARADFDEVVLWVGAPPPPSLAAAGYRVESLDAARLASLGIESAPLLVVVDPDDRVRYSGGYTERKQGPAPRDVELMTASRDGAAVAALPVLGCAVSERLQQALASLPQL